VQIGSDVPKTWAVKCNGSSKHVDMFWRRVLFCLWLSDKLSAVLIICVRLISMHMLWNLHNFLDRQESVTMSSTSRQSNLTTGSIAAEHGRFIGIHQVAPVCIPLNAWFLEPTLVQIPNSSRQRVALLNNRPLPPLKLPPSVGDMNPHLINGSLDPLESSTQTASLSVQPFLQGSRLWQTDRQSTLCNNRPHLHM